MRFRCDFLHRVGVRDFDVFQDIWTIFEEIISENAMTIRTSLRCSSLDESHKKGGASDPLVNLIKSKVVFRDERAIVNLIISSPSTSQHNLKCKSHSVNLLWQS